MKHPGVATGEFMELEGRKNTMKLILARLAEGARLALVTGVAGMCLAVEAQTNSWTSPTSGNWEDLTWSLGVRPGPGQTVLLSNHGWKALAIGPNTALNFPQTMTIDALAVISPGTDTVNTVLLNYAGFQTPLVTRSLYVSNDTALVILQSALEVTNNGTMTVGGTVSHGAFSQVEVDSLQIQSAGVYNLTNGTFTGAQENIVGGLFRQEGGSNYCFFLNDGGEYDLLGGDLVAGNRETELHGNIIQSGGTMTNSMAIGRSGMYGGYYELSGGIHGGAVTELPSSSSGLQPDTSSVLQSGGTNFAGDMTVGASFVQDIHPWFGMGYYTLSNGVLVTASLAINGHGQFYQSGGVHSNGVMTMTESEFLDQEQPGAQSYEYWQSGYYSLSGGTFASELVDMEPGEFVQSGGEGQLGTLKMVAGQYHLNGGLLNVSNVNLSLGAALIQTGGTVAQSGTLTLADASLSAGVGAQQFGWLQLSGDSNSSFLMPIGACVFHFPDSRSMIWSNGPTLVIENWAGSLSGGGMQKVIFGNSNTALTSAQLSQIQFQNPAGVSAGIYPAVILADGEIIPDPSATASKVNPARLNLAPQFDGGMQVTLQGAAGRSYAIMTSTNLVDWSLWTNEFNTNGTCSAIDCGATNCAQRFYRAVLQP